MRESSASTREVDAERLLKRRLGEIYSQKFIGPVQEKLTYEDIEAGYLRSYDRLGLRSKSTAELRTKHLRRFFCDQRALNITADTIERYQEYRLDEGAAPSTVNRETAALQRMFTLAVRAQRMSQSPIFPEKLEEAEPRQGFFEHAEYLAIREHLHPDYQDVLDFGYYSGWRKSEITGLAWAEVDLSGNEIRLRPSRSKTKQARTLPIIAPLREVLDRRAALRSMDSPFVFHHKDRSIGDWRKSWKNACRAAGLHSKLFHDLRRSVARNLVRAGVTETVAMRITGHRSRSVFKRYNITTDDDLLEAGRALANYALTQASENTLRTVTEARREEENRTITAQLGGSRLDLDERKTAQAVDPAVLLNGGADEIRTRDLRRDRPAF